VLLNMIIRWKKKYGRFSAMSYQIRRMSGRRPASELESGIVSATWEG